LKFTSLEAEAKLLKGTIIDCFISFNFMSLTLLIIVLRLVGSKLTRHESQRKAHLLGITDGLITALMLSNSKTVNHKPHIKTLRAFFIGLGGSRYARLAKGEEKKKHGGANGRQVTQEDLDILGLAVQDIRMELGFPCNHCKQKNYVMDVGQTWKSLYEKYVVFHGEYRERQNALTSTGETDEQTAATDTIAASSKNDNTSLPLYHQRAVGEVLAFETWRQYMRTVYSHVALRK